MASVSHATWEHFPHEADIGVRGRGTSPDIAFAQAALGLTAVVTDPSLGLGSVSQDRAGLVGLAGHAQEQSENGLVEGAHELVTHVLAQCDAPLENLPRLVLATCHELRETDSQGRLSHLASVATRLRIGVGACGFLDRPLDFASCRGQHAGRP